MGVDYYATRGVIAMYLSPLNLCGIDFLNNYYFAGQVFDPETMKYLWVYKPFTTSQFQEMI